GQILKTLKLAGQETASQRAVGDEADSQFTAGVEDLVFWIASPQRIFCLQCCDGMNFRGTSQRLRTGLRQTDVTNLAVFYQLSHRSNRLFNGRVGIYPVLIIQIDSLDPEAAQAALTGGTNIIRLTIYGASG